MNRRDAVLSLLALGAVPLRCFAQDKGRRWRVGFLASRRRPASLGSDFYGAFLDKMRELGYVEGKNLVVEWRFAEGDYERLTGLAAELVQLKVDVIVTSGSPATRAAQKVTTTIPIVMAVVGDPLGSGIVTSLARPGGNLTGTSLLLGDMGPKQLEMLLSVVPKLSHVAVLFNPANFSQFPLLKSVQTAAQKTKVKILPVELRTPQEIEKAFATMRQQKAEALIVLPDPISNDNLREIAAHAAKIGLPSADSLREYVVAGGLMSYGQNYADNFRVVATYVDKIFKGANPGDLPIEQPTKFEMFINRKTAKALGLTIPQSLLISADRVIE